VTEEKKEEWKGNEKGLVIKAILKKPAPTPHLRSTREGNPIKV
jgi:hypothetical protein